MEIIKKCYFAHSKLGKLKEAKVTVDKIDAPSDHPSNLWTGQSEPKYFDDRHQKRLSKTEPAPREN